MRIVSVVALCSLALLVLGFAHADADACTSFFVGGHDGRLMAFNYDWPVSGGRLMVNPNGLVKTALVKDGLNLASWTARFGSVTFNQYGREFPNGGMNRAGLAMHALWLDGALSAAKAQTAQARANFLQAQRAYQRNVEIRKTNPQLVSDADLEQSKTQMEVNEALLESATHNVDQSTASVRDAKNSLAKTTILAR